MNFNKIVCVENKKKLEKSLYLGNGASNRKNKPFFGLPSGLDTMAYGYFQQNVNRGQNL